jgi:hypothetical protein
MPAKGRKASTRSARAKSVLQEELLETLKTRFQEHAHRHEGLEWEEVESRLEARPALLRSLQGMEDTGGEPDVVGRAERTGRFLFVD